MVDVVAKVGEHGGIGWAAMGAVLTVGELCMEVDDVYEIALWSYGCLVNGLGGRWLDGGVVGRRLGGEVRMVRESRAW